MTSVPRCGICHSTRALRYPHRWTEPVYTCEGCQARFVFPQPAPADLRERYQQEHARGKWEERFRAQHDTEVLRRVRLLTRLLGKPGRLLDVGSGDGRFLRAARAADWRGLGCEIVEPAAALARDQVVFVGSLEATREEPLFDAITFWDVLEHVSDPAALISNAAARLRPGGLVAVSMPNVRGTSSRMLGRAWPYYDFATYGHLFHLSPAHIDRLFGAAGLGPHHRETSGSVDLRDLSVVHLGFQLPRPARWLADRLSGALAPGAIRRDRGNTLLVVGRRPE